MRKHPLRLAISLAISLGALALSLRGVRLDALWEQLKLADYWYLLAHLGILVLIQLARTVRWGLLLAPVKRMSFRRLIAISSVGFMALVVLPLRLGEFARPYLVREPGRVSGSAAMVSIVLERILDGLAVAGLLLVLLLDIPDSLPHVAWARRGAVLVLLGFVGLLAMLAVAGWRRELALRLAAGLARFSPWLSGKLVSFVGALSALPTAGELAGICLLTAGYWALNGYATWVLARGFGIPLGLLEAFACMGIRALGIMLPAGPGMVGTFQAFMQLGLAMFLPGLPAASAAAFANVLWACQLCLQVSLGLIFLGSPSLVADHHGVTLAELSHAGESLRGQ
jgi:uncharacterized protein (TIRG00374 family)